MTSLSVVCAFARLGAIVISGPSGPQHLHSRLLRSPSLQCEGVRSRIPSGRSLTGRPEIEGGQGCVPWPSLDACDKVLSRAARTGRNPSSRAPVFAVSLCACPGGVPHPCGDASAVPQTRRQRDTLGLGEDACEASRGLRGNGLLTRSVTHSAPSRSYLVAWQSRRVAAVVGTSALPLPRKGTNACTQPRLS